MDQPGLSVEKRAIIQATAYFASQGYKVENVSRHRGHNGYDLLVARSGTSSTVEVKGCSRPWQIPDLFNTEFDAHGRLVADILCVIYFAPGLKNTLCLIPREAIPREMVVPKLTYRISSRFKKQSVLQQFSHRFVPTSDG